MSTIQLPSKLPAQIFSTPIADKNGFCTSQIWQRIFQIISTPAATPSFIADTHANRAKYNAGNYQDGSIYYETDRGTYYLVNGKAWQYLAGMMATQQATIPQDLAAGDVGFLVAVEDFDHLLRWNGTGYEFAPGDGGSGYTAAFITGVPPNGWAPCDGSANVSYLDSTGILLTTAVPNTPGTYFRQ